MATREMTFGQRLREMREKRGLTRRQVEDATGVSQRHLQYLEDDEKEPGRVVLQQLSALFGRAVIQAAFPDLLGSRTPPPRHPGKRSNPGYLDLDGVTHAEAAA